jgi:hypothetical protein
VTDHEDQLREAFATQDDQLPDPAAVYDRVQQLSQKYRRRRRVGQAAGGAVLGAGLIAGAIQLPAMLPGNSTHSGAIIAPAAASPSPSSTAETDKEVDAFLSSGYSYADAEALARLWNMPSDNLTAVKAEAGRRILAGETLPIKPAPVETTSPQDEKAVEKFFGTGYTYEDAQRLATMWKLPDAYAAKIAGGKKLLAGETLPFQPSPAGVEAAKEQAQAEAFWNAGYVYDDAVRLARLWKLKTASKAKYEGGKRLLAGQELPFGPKPANVQAVKDLAAENAFFAAGYDYNDAVKLADMWKLPSAGDAKVAAGKKILAGQTLPIKP